MRFKEQETYIISKLIEVLIIYIMLSSPFEENLFNKKKSVSMMVPVKYSLNKNIINFSI